MATTQQESLQAAFDYRELATRGDIQNLESKLASKDDLRKLEIELAVVKWMLGTVIAGIIALIIKTFFA